MDWGNLQVGCPNFGGRKDKKEEPVTGAAEASEEEEEGTDVVEEPAQHYQRGLY